MSKARVPDGVLQPVFFTQATLDRLNKLEARQDTRDAWAVKLKFVLMAFSMFMTAFAMFITAVWVWHDFSMYMWPPAPGGFVYDVGPPGHFGQASPCDTGMCNAH